MRTQDLANNEEDDVEQQQQHLLRKKHKIRLVSRGHSSWGQFNITPSVRSYLPMFSNLVQFKSVYHTLLDLTWWKLFLGFGAFYLVLHALFALLYWMGGLQKNIQIKFYREWCVGWQGEYILYGLFLFLGAND